MKLPLKRVPYSGSTDSYIEDADGNDIARVSPDNLFSPMGLPAVSAYPDKVADQIVRAVNYEPSYLAVIEWLSGNMSKSELVEHLATLPEDVIDYLLGKVCYADDDSLRVLVSVRRWNNNLERQSVNAKLDKLALEKS